MTPKVGRDRTQDTGPLSLWLERGSRLLDLACGNGEILTWAKRDLDVGGCGVEIDSDCIQQCLESGLDVLEQDLNRPLDMFTDNSFDTVLAKEALHYVTDPEETLRAMLRIGRRAIVAFDNDGWWQRRSYFIRTGRYLSEDPDDSYWKHRARLFSVADFEDLCRNIGCEVLERHFHPRAGPSANLFASRAWYLLRKD